MNNTDASGNLTPMPVRQVRLILLWVSFLALVCSLVSCRTSSDPPDSSLSALAVSAPSIPGTLQEGDVIQLTFAVSTNLNTTQRITLDGNLSLQFVGKVKASGKTPSQLEETLKTLYQPQLRGQDAITATVISSVSGIYVTGAVLRPGKIPLDRPMTVLDAVMEAGGVDITRAKLSSVTVLRVDGDKRVARKVNLRRALEGKDGSLFYVRPFDIIYVPEKTINF